MYLHEQLETLRQTGHTANVPQYIIDNLNSNFELRPYQVAAFENFITYFENPKLCRKPTQTLFHMATGSGKTLIMAGLMLYLYKRGYRDFLFFVNLTNIVKKTKDNFLNAAAKKYLFGESIAIDGETITIKEVENFQYSDPNAINIRFVTTQGLHYDMLTPKENAITFEDFKERRVALISDESHHINASTKKIKKDEEADNNSWEYTVSRILEANIDNVLLEFTATCDINNSAIRAKYEGKIIFDYPLKKFRDDKYSKEIKTLRSDMPVMDKILQACMLSQYRLKVFQDNRLAIKPVIMLKAKRSTPDIKTGEKTANEWMEEFIQIMNRLSGDTLSRIANETSSETMNAAYQYFNNRGITFDMLAQELRDDFCADHCISANDDKEAEENQILLNSLEDINNPYRAIFAVNKLDEGWDVLNLFDIVRLYETRQSGGKNISPTTISEAQLIGRGARYCPFNITAEQAKYQRKYDDFLESPLRICEELHYHCQNDSHYIGELHKALREIGLDIEKAVTRRHTLKDTFRNDVLFKDGFVFINEPNKVSRDDVDGLPQSILEWPISVRLATGHMGEDIILEDSKIADNGTDLYTTHTTIGDIARVNYSCVHKALRRYDVFRFNVLRCHLPNLKSIHDFICGDSYLNLMKVNITSKYDKLPPSVLFDACVYVLKVVADVVEKIEDVYKGDIEFRAKAIRDVFHDKSVLYTDPSGEGRGVSQGDSNIPAEYRIDLSREDWYAFNDDYGTIEEKRFVAYFKSYVSQLRSKYDKVFLVRNERQLAIYSFESGERFEPDYLLFIQSKKPDGYEQYQIFIEPKGSHLIDKEPWKEKFLLELEAKAVPVKIFVDDNEYRIWGFHFFNHEVRGREFDNDFRRIL